MRIPKVVHAEIVESVRNDYLNKVNRADRRRIVSERRAGWRKLPRSRRLETFNQLKEQLS